MDLICMLWRAEPRGVLSYRMTQWQSLLRCAESELVTVLDEFTTFTICDIETISNGYVTISSRRMLKDEKERKYVRLRVARHRRNVVGNATVRDCNRENQNQKSESEVRSQKSEEELREKKKKKKEERKIAGAVLPVLAPAPKSGLVWESYRRTYAERYGVDPVRNQQTNSMLCKLVDKLGAEEAAHVAAFYLTHNNPYYVGKRHPVNLLLVDAEGLRTQWATNTKATTSEARNAEMKDSVIEQAKRVEAILQGRRV